MATINTSSFHSSLLPIVTNWFGTAYSNMPTYYDKMLKVESMSKAYEIDAIVETMGLLQAKDEGNPLTYDFSKEGYHPTYKAVAYALGFILTREMMEDGDAMRNAKNFTEQLKYSAMQTKETIAANVFNNAFSSSYTMLQGDTKELVSNAHPVVGGTQSNLITGGSVDISEAALEQITIDIRNMKNARGLRINAQPDKLICSVNDAPAANRILYSTNRVATSDNDQNYLRANNLIPGGIVANPFLTDSDAYFVTTTVPNGLKFKVRKDLTIEDGNDFDTKNAKYSAIMRVTAGWTDWRSVVGSAGV